jgi:hypothetical protein
MVYRKGTKDKEFGPEWGARLKNANPFDPPVSSLPIEKMTVAPVSPQVLGSLR